MSGMAAINWYVASMAGQNPATGTPHRWPTSIAQEANKSTIMHATTSPSSLNFRTRPSKWLGMFISIAFSLAKKSRGMSISNPSGIEMHEIWDFGSIFDMILRWMNSGVTITGSNPWSRKAEASLSKGVTWPCAGYGTRMILGVCMRFIFPMLRNTSGLKTSYNSLLIFLALESKR